MTLQLKRSHRNDVARAVRIALASSAAAAAMYGIAAHAQDAAPQDDTAADVGTIVVTGSRIQRQDYVANSPVTTVTAEQIVENADITLDTYINLLPQVNPAGTTTSNNPGNSGQANIDLRGLGSNRNLILLDGRRAMPSDSLLRVDLNTIPQGLIESIEIVTGGAGAVYGADAVAGAVNIKLKDNFEGGDLRYSYTNSTEEWDAQEYQFSGLLGGNFSDDRGNGVLAFDYSKREGMIKSQREFAAVATSTTSYLPEGLYIPGSNGPSQAAVDALFATYGSAAGAANPTLLGFNLDGTLFSRGIFNSPLNVENWRYPVDLAVNTNLFPDVYSYNFDAVNILTLPLERRSFMGKLDYEFDGGIEAFAQIGWTEYDSTQALAPTPFPTVQTRAPGAATPIQATSANVMPGSTITGNLVVPVTNPFIPADFAALLATRTADNTTLVGSGATEPFMMRQRSLSAGLRTSDYENTVVQYLVGFRGPLFSEKWSWEVYGSEGTTEIAQTQGGNLDTQRLYQLIEAPDGGESVCAGGLDLFGRNPISPACVSFLEVSSTVSNDFTQQILQGFVTGEVLDMPAGPLSVVIGVEGRWFDYELDPGAAAGPISGFTAQNPAKGNNSFEDVFFEALIPILRDAPLAESLELSVGYRSSSFEFEDEVQNLKSDSQSSDAYKAELSWQPIDSLRFRGSYQRAVRAPNFSELFDGGGSAPQYFDPCSVTSEARNGPNAAQMRQLCLDAGAIGGISPTAIDVYVQTPGNQIQITLAGNNTLKPETADTYTLGFVFTSPWSGALQGLQGSLDFYSIDISDPILSPSPNVYVAECYNYYGTNPNFDENNPNCVAIIRTGGDILGISSPDDPVNGTYPGINAGKTKTTGLDMQINYAVDVGKGNLRLNLLTNYLMSFEQQDRPEFPLIDYAGTASYFGEGLGSTYPEWRANLSARYSISDFAFDLRTRWIDSMENRAGVQFPGETEFTGPEAMTYLDAAVTWGFLERSSLRIGVNNLTDEQPPEYAPNVQSGTDPSYYDVIGRRIFGQVNVRF